MKHLKTYENFFDSEKRFIYFDTLDRESDQEVINRLQDLNYTVFFDAKEGSDLMLPEGYKVTLCFNGYEHGDGTPITGKAYWVDENDEEFKEKECVVVKYDPEETWDQLETIINNIKQLHTNKALLSN